MRFLANENIPLPSVRRLQQEGYDVASIILDSPGAKDLDVLERARREGRVLLSFDRDYGDLIYRQKMPVPVGVVYFRFDPSSPEEPAEHLLQLLAVRGLSLEGRFTVAERVRVRQRRLP